MHGNNLEPFPEAEYESRIERARAQMLEHQLDAIVVTSEPNFYYFTGFYSQFFVSPSRPWFFILPLNQAPCAIIPQLGTGPMTESTWVRNFKTWISPNPEDEGVSLVASFLNECKSRFGRVGFELGPESRMGFPVQDFLSICDLIRPTEAVDCEGLVRALRYVKSEREISYLFKVCQIVSDCYESLPGSYKAGDTEREVATRLKHQAFSAGVDRIPYLVFNTGQGGYRTAINDPSDHVLEEHDIFTIDTGCCVKGYYSDFNRNWAIGKASDEVRLAYDILYRATDAGLAAVRPGIRTSDLFRAQMAVVESELYRFRSPLQERNTAGRFGHGLGLHLTEPPSNSPNDDTVLVPGVVLTIEPGIFFSQTQLMLTEENIVVTEDGYEMLSRRAPRELTIIPA